MNKLFILLGSGNAFLAVACGAFGAHGLKNMLSIDMLTVYQTAAHYHLIHALGLICIGILAQSWTTSWYLKTAGWLLIIGIVLFSGSLYALSISGWRPLGMITPLGGVAFLLGWFSLMLASYNS